MQEAMPLHKMQLVCKKCRRARAEFEGIKKTLKYSVQPALPTTGVVQDNAALWDLLTKSALILEGVDDAGRLMEYRHRQGLSFRTTGTFGCFVAGTSNGGLAWPAEPKGRQRRKS